MRTTTVVFLSLLAFLLLVRYFFYFDSRVKYKEGDIVKITYSFLQEPRHNSFGQYFFTSNLLVTTSSYPRYHYGDKITLFGTVKEDKNKKGDILVLKNPRIEKIEEKNLLIKTAIFVRSRIENIVLQVLPSKEAGLFLGIILGVRDKIDNAFYDKLKVVGVLHIIAASGQNISILASILLISLSTLVKRKVAILFTVICILFYALLTGLNPPIVRASIMAILSFGAMIMGRQSSGLYALSLTGWGMLLVEPELISDVSFQLSFLSTFGIITIKPIIDNILNIRFVRFLKDDITTTLSAQIATIPLMLISFGAYSALSLPVNVLILWMIPPLMLGGILSLFISLFSPVMAIPFIILSYPFLAYFSFVIEIFAGIKLSFQLGNLPSILIIGYYLMLIAIVIKFQRREGGKI